MLTLVEKILFVIAVLVSLYFTWQGVQRIIRIIGRGRGKPDWSLAWKRLWDVIIKVGTFQPVFRFRLGPSLLHALIGWGFLYFILVNLAEFLNGYIPGFRFAENAGLIGNLYRLMADIFGAGVIIGILGMVIRRFIVRPPTLTTRESTTFDPRARTGIRRDSAIVATFVLVHVSARLMGESMYLAAAGNGRCLAADRFNGSRPDVRDEPHGA
jgi:hypothetical protein